MMVIDNKFSIAETVYLKTDTEQDLEISTEKNILVSE